MFNTILATTLKLLAIGNFWLLLNSAVSKSLHLHPPSRRYLNKLCIRRVGRCACTRGEEETAVFDGLLEASGSQWWRDPRFICLFMVPNPIPIYAAPTTVFSADPLKVSKITASKLGFRNQKQDVAEHYLLSSHTQKKSFSHFPKSSLEQQQQVADKCCITNKIWTYKG